MQAPTASELLNDPVVQQAIESAWADSLVDDPQHRHEEGGWIYFDPASRAITVRRAATGTRAELDLDTPPLVSGLVLVATFHTHPNPSAEGWQPGPSEDDEQFAWSAGVPWLIRADDGCHSAGPDSRRDGLAGNPGYPD